jgi:hypothetical protein
VGETTVAERIADHAKDLGYGVGRDASKLSASRYLSLTHEKLPDQNLKVRVSDHDLPLSYGLPGDLDVYANERPSGSGIHWSDAIAHLAARVGEPVPPLARREIDRRAEKEQQKAERESVMRRTNPAYQEGVLEQTYPKEWKAAVALEGRERSDARRALASRYEQDKPGHLQWAPYLKPRAPEPE